jgi:uncharacterized membrane protein
LDDHLGGHPQKEKMKVVLAFHSSFQYHHPWLSILFFVVGTLVLAFLVKWWADKD